MHEYHPNHQQSGLKWFGDDKCEETGNGLRENKDWIISFAEPQPECLCQHQLPPFPPAASGAPRVPGHTGTWQVSLFSFTVVLFSPELLSVLESCKLSVAVDLCLNFCSQFTGFLLLWGWLMVVLIPVFWMVIHSQPWPLWWPSGSPLVTPTSAPEIWKTSFLWQPKNNLSVTGAWKGTRQAPLFYRYWPGEKANKESFLEIWG